MSFEGTMALVTNQCFSLWRLYVTLGVEWAVKPHSLTYSLSMLIIMSFHFLAIRFSAKQQSLPEENIVPQDSVITIESDSGMFLRPQFKVNMFLLWLRKKLPLLCSPALSQRFTRRHWYNRKRQLCRLINSRCQQEFDFDALICNEWDQQNHPMCWMDNK